MVDVGYAGRSDDGALWGFCWVAWWVVLPWWWCCVEGGSVAQSVLGCTIDSWMEVGARAGRANSWSSDMAQIGVRARAR